MAKRRNYDDIKIEIIPHYIPQEEMTDLIIRALFGSRRCAAYEFLKWEAEREKNNKKEPTI